MVCGSNSADGVVFEAISDILRQRHPEMTLIEAHGMLAEISQYERQTFPRFCEALEMTPDETSFGQLYQVIRWSAHDYLHDKYGIEMEELHFFIDHAENCFGQPEQIISPLQLTSPRTSPNFWRTEQSATLAQNVSEFKLKLEPLGEEAPRHTKGFSFGTNFI